MLIKYTALEEDKLGTYDAYRIDGLRIDNEQEWSKKFFANNKKILADLEQFAFGQTINVRMQQKGKNWNILAVEAPDPDLVARVQSKIGGDGGSGPSSDGNKSTTKSTWGGRSGEAYDRSASIYLAYEWTKHNNSFKTKKGEQVVTAEEAFELAEDINKYIHSGMNPYAVFKKETALEPPDVE